MPRSILRHTSRVDVCSTPARRRSRPLGLPVIGLAALLVLTGCGGDSGESTTQVASLPTTAASAPGPGAAPGGAVPATSAAGTSSDAPAGARPQRRLDTSEEEEKRMWAAYEACLTSKGVDTRQTGSVEGEIARTKRYAREFKECEVKLPLMPPEMDPKQNPGYDDGMRAWVKCMNDKGMKVKLVSDGWTFTGESSLTNEQQRRVEQACKTEAFGGKR